MNIFQYLRARTPFQRVQILHDEAIAQQRDCQFAVVEARDNLHAAESSMIYASERVMKLAAELKMLQRLSETSQTTGKSRPEAVVNPQLSQ